MFTRSHEVATLREQAGYWKGMFEQAKRKNEKLQKGIDSLRAENRQVKGRLFAAKGHQSAPPLGCKGARSRCS